MTNSQHSPASLVIIWDYDTALGQLNATYPYRYRMDPLLQERDNVDWLLDHGTEHALRMTFACVAFSAEESVAPFDNREQIRRIHEAGHEIASHSWKHEWFPYLEARQIEGSLTRSREVLGALIGDEVHGFVPPHSRPMSWYSRGAVSLGDRVLGPQYPGANLGTLLPFTAKAGYSWVRVMYRTLWEKMWGRRPSILDTSGIWQKSHGVYCVPQHRCGFDEESLRFVGEAVEKKGSVVIIAHPGALSRKGAENRDQYLQFIDRCLEWTLRDELSFRTVQQHIHRMAQ